MSTITYPKTWNPGDVLSAADLNAQFAAVNTIGSVMTSQLNIGAAINAVVSAPLNGNLTITNQELTICTLPSLTTRGGRVVILPFAALTVQVNGAQSIGNVSLRLKRGGTTVTNGQIDVGIGNTGSTIVSVPVSIPAFLDSTGGAGSFVYTITFVSPLTTISGVTAGSNLGQVFAIELA